MNGDALELMQKLGEIHADLKEDIGQVRTDLKKDIGQVNTDIAGFKGSFGIRLDNIETDAKDEKYWHNVKTFVVIPVTFALHKAATALGFKI